MEHLGIIKHDKTTFYYNNYNMDYSHELLSYNCYNRWFLSRPPFILNTPFLWSQWNSWKFVEIPDTKKKPGFVERGVFSMNAAWDYCAAWWLNKSLKKKWLRHWGCLEKSMFQSTKKFQLGVLPNKNSIVINSSVSRRKTTPFFFTSLLFMNPQAYIKRKWI